MTAHRPRLPPPPDLAFQVDGTPVSTRYGDVYFSAGEGLAEARAVFLEGLGLPDAWAGRNRFVILETGFGTGLNFLAAWDMWRAQRPGPEAQLIWISLEGFPLSQTDAARALSPFTELAGLAARLKAVWPQRMRGVQSLAFPEDGVRLILIQDEALPALDAIRCQADAIVLDGFAPARNADLWSPEVFRRIAGLARTGARLASFTVAGVVRRGLAEAGFSVAKRPGHGRKRERLEAVLHTPATSAPDVLGLDLNLPARAPGRVAVIGAGLAGAGVVAALVERGIMPTVFEALDAPAGRASGNRLGLAMPRLDGADGPMARALIESWVAADQVYRRLPDTVLRPVTVQWRPDAATHDEKIERLLADPPLEGLARYPAGGLALPGYVVRPRALVAALLGPVAVAVSTPVAGLERSGTVWRLHGPDGKLVMEADTVILAGGADMIARFGLDWLPVSGRFGQVEQARTAENGTGGHPVRAVASGDYLIEMDGEFLFGASFSPHGAGEDVKTRPADRERNLARLQGLDPAAWQRAQTERLTSRAGVRATLPDRLAVIGPVPDAGAYLEAFAGLKKGQAPSGPAPVLDGLYVCTGFGARGLVWSPFAGGLVASEACGEPVPASLAARSALAPARFLFRGLKRGSINAC